MTTGTNNGTAHLESNCTRKMPASLKQTASRASFWGLSGNLGVSAMSFVGTAILARILSPKDFGLLGIAVLVTGIVRLFGHLGLGAALVHKKDIDDEYLSTSFWSSLFAGIALSIIAIGIAPLASTFFNEPIVLWIIICLSANFVISALASVQKTLAYRDIRIRKVALIEIVSRFVRVIIIIASALAGMGVWSIVIGMISESILKTFLFILTSSWRPTFQYNVTKFKELFRFGRNIYGQGFLNYFNQNLDFIVTGRLLGTSLLGFYQFSYNLPFLVKHFVQDGLATVAFPVFSWVQDDPERLSRGFLNAVKYISMITFPVMFGLAFCAEDFISVVYGIRWLPASEPMRLLCFGASFASLHCIVFSLFNAKGRPDIGLKWNLFRLPTTAILIVVFSRYGIIGIAGVMLTIEVLSVIMVYVAMKLIDTQFTHYLKAILPATISASVMTLFLYFVNTCILTNCNSYIRLPCDILAGSCMYILSLKAFYSRELSDLFDFIMLGVNKKRGLIPEC